MSEQSTSTEAGHVNEPVAPPKLVSQFTDGGHEIDHPPAGALMVFIGAMAVAIVLSTIMVYQLFVSSTNEVLTDAASRNNPILVEQDERAEDFNNNWGTVSLEGKQVGYRMPINHAKSWILDNPAAFKPATPPAGWLHPDDAKKATPKN